MLSISEMSKEQFREEIMKGLDDVKNGRVCDFKDFKAVFDCIAKGDIYLSENDFENAEKSYREATVKCDNKILKSYGFYKLGLLYYKFQKPDILYSKLYFELALDYGEIDASYYLATIYEWEKETDGIDYDPDQIDNLYRLAAEKAHFEDVKKLALEKTNK